LAITLSAGTEQPLHQVDVVARLIHDRAAVELPRAAPRLRVVILLRPRPANGHVRHVDAAKASLLDRRLEQLDGRVEAVLLDDEQVDARRVTGLHERVRALERDRHRLLGKHVTARFRRGDAVLRMEPRGRADGDEVTRHRGKHLVERSVGGNTVLFPDFLRTLDLRIGDGDELELGHLGDRLEMIATDAAAAQEGDTHPDLSLEREWSSA
jgi:hypothetical protein